MRVAFRFSSESILAVADSTTRVDVSEANGVYRVAASFAVSQSAEDVMAVLTNFERIPLYVPDMEISRVVERSADGMIARRPDWNMRP